MTAEEKLRKAHLKNWKAYLKAWRDHDEVWEAWAKSNWAKDYDKYREAYVKANAAFAKVREVYQNGQTAWLKLAGFHNSWHK